MCEDSNKFLILKIFFTFVNTKEKNGAYNAGRSTVSKHNFHLDQQIWVTDLSYLWIMSKSAYIHHDTYSGLWAFRP